MTGRDPDHDPEGPFAAVIRRATHADAADRHPTAAHLAEEFVQFVRVRNAPTPHVDVLAVPLASQGSNVDWPVVQRFLLDPKCDTHVFYGYLTPVMEFFSPDELLAQYCDTVGAECARFVVVFSQKVRECLATTGWPFSATGRFAVFFKRVFQSTSDKAARGECLKGMWDVAYGGDQWDAQRSLLGVFTSGQVGDEEAMALAGHILRVGCETSDDRLLDSAVPGPIRNAVNQL